MSAAALHPGRSARIDLRAADGTLHEVGIIGELHPKWKQSYGLSAAPVLFELDWAAVLAHPMPIVAPVPKVPFVQRDVAVVVKESVTHAQLMSAVMAAPQEAANAGLLRTAVLFDVYRPKAGDTSLAANEKSLAVRLTLGSDDQTLQDAQIESVVSCILVELTAQLQARLR